MAQLIDNITTAQATHIHLEECVAFSPFRDPDGKVFLYGPAAVEVVTGFITRHIRSAPRELPIFLHLRGLRLLPEVVNAIGDILLNRLKEKSPFWAPFFICDPGDGELVYLDLILRTHRVPGLVLHTSVEPWEVAVIGEQHPHLAQIFEFVRQRPSTTSNDAVAEFGFQLADAANRLKLSWKHGLIYRVPDQNERQKLIFRYSFQHPWQILHPGASPDNLIWKFYRDV